MQTRLLIALAGSAASLALICVLAFFGVQACAPQPLTGDELWSRLYHAQTAWELVSGTRGFDCFTEAAFGKTLVEAAHVIRPVPALLLLAAVFWELFGWRLRMAWLRSAGGHVLLAGAPEFVEAVPRDEGARVWLVRSRHEKKEASRAHPFRQIVEIDGTPEKLDKLGLKKAKLIIAASHVDAENLELADAAVTAKSKADVLVRIERPVSRALFSDDLRARAAKADVKVLCMSFSQMAQREALAQAMPGRFIDTRAHRYHFVVAGEGPELLEMAELIARQGYGLERQPPLLSVLALDASCALHPTLARLKKARQAVDVVVHHAEAQDREGIDQSMLRIMQETPPVSAIHCTGSKAGVARGLALRWERLLLASRVIVPPIVALDEGGVLGTTGMIRLARTPDLAESRVVSDRLDQHAKAAHDAYIAGRKTALGDEFGHRPAERSWDDLPERFRDDNRAFADHIGFKLSVAGLVVGKDVAAPSPDPAKHPRLGEVEHARWMSARVVDQWEFGQVRDDAKKIHPDIRPFEELDQDARQKDADVISSLVTTLGQSGEALFEETTFALDADWRPSAQEAKQLLERLHKWRAENPGAIPVLRIPVATEADVEIASQAIGATCAVELVLDADAFPGSALVENPNMATILRGAWRIRVVTPASPLPPAYRAADVLRAVEEET